MGNDGANNVDPVLERDNLGTQLHQRGEQIAARIEQLRDRFQELADDCRRGSTANDIATAQTHALKARECAQRAHLLAAQRHDQAAEAHTAGQSPRPKSLPVYISWYINGYG
jgi:hypothetical protein